MQMIEIDILTDMVIGIDIGDTTEIQIAVMLFGYVIEMSFLVDGETLTKTGWPLEFNSGICDSGAPIARIKFGTRIDPATSGRYPKLSRVESWVWTPRPFLDAQYRAFQDLCCRS